MLTVALGTTKQAADFLTTGLASYTLKRRIVGLKTAGLVQDKFILILQLLIHNILSSNSLFNLNNKEQERKRRINIKGRRDKSTSGPFSTSKEIIPPPHLYPTVFQI